MVGTSNQLVPEVATKSGDTEASCQALFGPGLASTVLELLEGRLQAVMRGPAPKRKVSLS